VRTTYTLSGLVPLTGYDVRVRHFKNGAYTSYATSTAPYASTLDLICTAPSSVSFASFGPPSQPSDPTGEISWGITQSTASTNVYLAGPSASAPTSGSYGLVYSAPPGTSSYTTGPVSTTGTYWTKVQHVQSGYTASAFTGPASASLYKFSTLR